MKIDIQYIPHVIATVALLLGGTGQYQTWDNNDNHTAVGAHTAANVGDLYIEIGQLKERIKRLEEGE